MRGRTQHSLQEFGQRITKTKKNEKNPLNPLILTHMRLLLILCLNSAVLKWTKLKLSLSFMLIYVPNTILIDKTTIQKSALFAELIETKPTAFEQKYGNGRIRDHPHLRYHYTIFYWKRRKIQYMLLKSWVWSKL